MSDEEFQLILNAIERVSRDASIYPTAGMHRVYRFNHLEAFSYARRAADSEMNDGITGRNVLLDYDLATLVGSPRFASIRNAIRRTPRVLRTEDV